MKKTILFIITIMIYSCSNEKQIDIHIYGALSKIMHKGARKGVVALNDVITDYHIYGLGAMENLDGEILIFDSKTIINRSQPGGLPTFQTRLTPETKALLLVSTQVNSWKSVRVNSGIDFQSIDELIKEKARRNGLNIDKPFPFIIEGEFSQINWHIISPQEKGGSHDDHLAKSWKRKDLNTTGKILGFYSEKHQAIFTHHTRFTHMHIMYESEMLSGHVDDFMVEKPFSILFPTD